MILTSTQKGNLGLGKAISFLTNMGYPVSIPLTDTQEYDLVAEIYGRLKRIQVKYVGGLQYGKKQYAVDLRTKNFNASGSKIKLATDMVYDYLFVVCGEKSCYFIPRKHFKNLTTKMGLGKKAEKYKVWPCGEIGSTRQS